jgi:hypothetical protein
LFDITYKNLKKLIDNNFFEKQDDLVLKQKVNLEKVSNNLSFEIKSKKIIKKLSNYQINFVINPYNLKFLIDSIDFLKALNIKIKFMIAAEYKLEEYLKNDFENMLKKMIKNHKYKKYFIKIFLSNFYKLTNACREDFLSSIIVNTDLKVVPCSLWTSILIKNYDFDNINILHIKKYTKTARLKILNQIFKSKHFLDATKKNLSICHLVNINTINGLKLILYKKIKNND